MEEKLKQYNDKIAEIKELNWKIKVLENEEIQPSSPTLEITGIKGQGFKSSPIEIRVAKNLDEINRCKKRVEELEAEINYIDAKIKTLKDMEQKIIIDYFINKRTAIDIASCTYREEKTIYRIIKRAIEKMTLK